MCYIAEWQALSTEDIFFYFVVNMVISFLYAVLKKLAKLFSCAQAAISIYDH